MFEKVILIHFVKLPRKILKFTLEVKKDNIKKNRDDIFYAQIILNFDLKVFNTIRNIQDFKIDVSLLNYIPSPKN